MTDADKLKQLIELAWANGWDGFAWRKEHLSQGYTLSFNFYDNSKELSITTNGVCDGFQVTGQHLSIIFFDHSFIKALAAAKYQGEEDWLEDVVIFGALTTVPKWQQYLISLALSTDRINYLYGEFCNDK